MKLENELHKVKTCLTLLLSDKTEKREKRLILEGLEHLERVLNAISKIEENLTEYFKFGEREDD